MPYKVHASVQLRGEVFYTHCDACHEDLEHAGCNLTSVFHYIAEHNRLKHGRFTDSVLLGHQVDRPGDRQEERGHGGH